MTLMKLAIEHLLKRKCLVEANTGTKAAEARVQDPHLTLVLLQ